MATRQQINEAIVDSGATGTAAQIATMLNAKTVSVHRSTRVKYADLVPIIGSDKITALDVVLSANGLGWLQRMLGSEQGVDFASQDFQDSLEALRVASKISAADAAVLKSIGRWNESPLERASSRGETCTEQQVAEAIAYAETVAKWGPFVTDVVNGINTGSISTWSDVIALAQARA